MRVTRSVEQLHDRFGVYPKEALVDGSFATHQDIDAVSKPEIGGTVSGLANGESALYDASKAVERGFSRSASLGRGPLFAHERAGVAPGPPDGGPSDQFLQRQIVKKICEPSANNVVKAIQRIQQ